jgi:hypothetical protein
MRIEMRLSLLSLSSFLGFVSLGSSGMGNSLSLSTLISDPAPILLREEDPLSKLNTEVFREACGAPGGTGDVGEWISRELVDFEAAVETEMLDVWWGMNGGKGGDSFWIAGDAFIEEEDERRKKGMFDGVRRLDESALLLIGGLVAERNAWEVVCVLALDSVRSVWLGVERSGVRVLAVVVGVGELSLIGFNEDIDGEAWRCDCDLFGDSMTDHDSDVWDELVDCLIALLFRGVLGDLWSLSLPGDFRFRAFEKLHFFVGPFGDGCVWGREGVFAGVTGW